MPELAGPALRAESCVRQMMMWENILSFETASAGLIQIHRSVRLQ